MTRAHLGVTLRRTDGIFHFLTDRFTEDDPEQF
jgi:hypothetical protein